MKSNKVPGVKVGLQGFSRVMLKENGEVIGDSGWCGPNIIVNNAVQNAIMNLIGKTTGSFQIAGLAVGSGGTTASDATIMGGEYGGTAKRKAVSVATTQRAASNQTATLQFSASWASGDNSGNSNLSNIGLFDVTNAQGNLFAANTFASSAWSNNQDLYASYQLRISFT